MRAWKREEYVYCYYVMSLGAFVLYKDFVRSVKDANDGWLRVKLALEQIVVKSSRADNYSYKEMLQHLNDLEAARTIRFSKKIITMFISVCRRTLDFLCSISVTLSKNPLFMPEKSLFRKLRQKMLPVKEFAKISSIPIAGLLCLTAVYVDQINDLKDIINRSSSSPWEYLFKSFTIYLENRFGENGWFMLQTWYKRDLQISDFCDNRILLQQVMKKIGRSECFTKENKEEMKSVIDKLQNNINKGSSTIQDMSSHADQYSRNIQKARKHVKRFSRLSKEDNIISMLPLFNLN